MSGALFDGFGAPVANDVPGEQAGANLHIWSANLPTKYEAAVVNLAPEPVDVLDAVALALSDIEVLLRTSPQAKSS